MSFFGGEFFKGSFRKNMFFGGQFFQNKYFDETTIAHGLTGGTGDPSLVTVVCNRTIEGTFDIEDGELLIDGTPATINTISFIGKDLNIAIADTITAGQTLIFSFTPLDKNNVGAMDNFPIVNNVLATRRKKKAN